MFARRQNVVVAPRGGCQRGCHGQALDGLVGRHAQEGHIAVLGQHDVLELVLHVEAVAVGALELLGNQEYGAGSFSVLVAFGSSVKVLPGDSV